jgi:DNA-binding response OmpR family regulator
MFMRTTTYDLIVLDINLPDQTGWDVLRSALSEGYIKPLLLEGQGEKLPVVVLSAVRVGPSRLAEFHPLAYLPKPFPMDALLRLAAEAAQRRAASVSKDESIVSDQPKLNEEELHA